MILTSTSFLIPILDASGVGAARRYVSQITATLGFSEIAAGRAAIVVTELANNLIKHTQQGGEIILTSIKAGNTQGINTQGIEILSLDRGPGMPNVAQCLQDGYSTLGSSGTGLGAVQRLSASFDIFSLAEIGTAVYCQLWGDTPGHSQEPRPFSQFEIGALCLPHPRETAYGDHWIASLSDGPLIMVADGLGHGDLASKASYEAIRLLMGENTGHLSLAEIIQLAHGALKNTRGAALALARIASHKMTFAGVGNIAAVVWQLDGSCRHAVSNNGTVGIAMQKVQEFCYPWDNHSILIMHSDGLATHWSLNSYRGILNKHPSLIAGVLYRDFKRGTDDVTVVVVRKVRHV